MDHPQTSYSSEEQSPSRTISGCSTLVLIALVFFWLGPITCAGQLPIMTASALPGNAASITGLISGIVRLILIGFPLAGLAYAWRRAPHGKIIGPWFFAALFSGLIAPLHLISPIRTQLQSLLMVLFGLLFIGIFAVWNDRKRRTLDANSDAEQKAIIPVGARNAIDRVLWSIVLGLMMLVPWLAYGAFGSIVDVILSAVLALVIGSLAVALLRYFFPEFIRAVPGIDLLKQFAFLGLAFFGTLSLIAGSLTYPFGTIQLLLIACLPGISWAAAGLMLSGAESRKSMWIPPLLLISLAAFGPLAMFDPDETTLVATASQGEVLQYAAIAGGLSLLLGVLVSGGMAAIFFMSMRNKTSSGSGTARLLAPVFLLLAAAGAAAVYYAAGTPGFYGERLFVIFKDQADLSDLRLIKDPVERRETAYKILVDQAEATQTPIWRSLDRLGVGYTPFYLVNAVAVEDSLPVRIWLEFQPQVDRILTAQVMRPLPEQPPVRSAVPQAPPPQPPWNVTMIHAEQVWKDFGVTGDGILIGQSDSGVDWQHVELADAYRGLDQLGDSWYDPWYHTDVPRDLGGHGTHTLATILGKHVGVAPDAAWIACVNLARNLGNPELYLDCWQYNFAPFPTGGSPFNDGNPARGAHILNNSWGCPEIEGCDLHTFDSAAAALRAAGIFVVASAGNDGPTCGSLIVPPPTVPGILSVGAVDRSGRLAFFSSIGGPSPDSEGDITPDLVAPGQDVLSAVPGNGYERMSGTSMAGPHAAGVVALMWSANPALIGDVERTEQILIQSASPYTEELPDCPGVETMPSTAVGYGLLDAYAAVAESIRIR